MLRVLAVVVVCLVLVFTTVFVSAAGIDKSQKPDVALSRVVDTEFGKVQGVLSSDKNYAGVVEFKSIPYAAPPVGELRWQPPVDPQKWSGVKVSDTYAPAPLQMFTFSVGGTPYGADFYWDGAPNTSEDCLYLNIVTTNDSLNKKNEKKPVYVWFHGGSLTGGWYYENEFNGEAFAKNGVIVVSVAQRVGVFGYLSLPQLSEEQGQSGNYGLMDGIKALEWVEKNIANFGGDPNNITVGGQSGGTTKSMAIVASPENKTSIKRLILESGLKYGYAPYNSQATAEQKGLDYIDALKLPAKIGLAEGTLAKDISLDDLRKIDANTIANFDLSLFQLYPGSMNIDGLYVTEPSLSDSIDAGRFDNVSILSGTNLGEGSYQKTYTAADFYTKYKTLLGDLYDKYDFKNLVKVTDDTALQVSRTLGTYGLGTNNSRSLMLNRLYGKLMEQRPNAQVKNYTYLFTHFTPESVSDIGTARGAATQWAWHSSELFYAFNSIRPGVPASRNWTQWDYDLAKQMNQYWTNFIKTGDPNGKGLENWPVADSEMGYIVLGDGISSRSGELTKLEQLMQEFTVRTFNIPIQ